MTIVDYICIGVICACFIAMIICVIAFFKNNNTYRNSQIILNAICDYQLDCINNGNYNYLVDYSDMKSYDDMFNNVFDWGYTNVLLKEKFEIIKPYILEERK